MLPAVVSKFLIKLWGEPLQICTDDVAVAVVPSKVYVKVRKLSLPAKKLLGLDGREKYKSLVFEPTKLRLVLFSGWMLTLEVLTEEIDL